MAWATSLYLILGQLLIVAVLLLFTDPIARTIAMPPKPKLNVHSFPRPPLLEKTQRHLQIKWQGQVIADTKNAYWVLETTHPPSMQSYLPIYLLTYLLAL